MSGATISLIGLNLVKHFEGCQLVAYQDEVGVWTIGYGHTGLQHKDGTVHKGRIITQAEADQLLAYDMHQSEAVVNSVVRVPLSQPQFDALVAFTFNTGGLATSTLLKHLNAGRTWEAANQFGAWVKAGGKTLAGLVRRRAAERDLFCGFDWTRWKN
jgi:GH24 family phage-related lysozyme (muramidase)